MRSLNRELILSPEYRERPDLEVPTPELLELPEKILQFGTGAFLRGFVEYFVERANRQGLFNGRIVAVSSTESGRANQLTNQEGLYSLVVEGRKDGRVVDEASVVSALSRALSVQRQWGEVLECASNPDLEVIVSNTTEIGITMHDADGPHAPPQSFPGKVAAFLHERAHAFDFDPAKALVVLPCELVENNGERLRDIVAVLARRWSDSREFTEWLRACTFCNTLVDRIVPGMPDKQKQAELYNRLGYRDELLTIAEPYRLWAIQGEEELTQRLPFLRADEGIVVTPDISPYRELKVRILNGTHTIMVPIAIECGLQTVREAITDPVVGNFVRHVMLDEIVPSLDVDEEISKPFALAVLDRFDNPFIDHPLRSIMLQATMKCRVRILPSILAYVNKSGEVPVALAMGLALFLLFRRDDNPDDYPPDDLAEVIRKAWRELPSESESDVQALVHGLLSKKDLWQTDLMQVTGLEEVVVDDLMQALQQGVRQRLHDFVNTLELE